MTTHTIVLGRAELAPQSDGTIRVRVPVRASNSRTAPGSFAKVHMDTGRGRAAAGNRGEIRARGVVGKAERVVTISPLFLPGHILHARPRVGDPMAGKPRYFVVQSIHGRRLRDVRAGEEYDAAAWAERYGGAAYARNPWVWSIKLVPAWKGAA